MSCSFVGGSLGSIFDTVLGTLLGFILRIILPALSGVIFGTFFGYPKGGFINEGRGLSAELSCLCLFLCIQIKSRLFSRCDRGPSMDLNQDL